MHVQCASFLLKDSTEGNFLKAQLAEQVEAGLVVLSNLDLKCLHPLQHARSSGHVRSGLQRWLCSHTTSKSAYPPGSLLPKLS